MKGNIQSRMALAGGEFERATHVESIDTIKEAQDKAHEFNVRIREVNTDRDTRFYSIKKRESTDQWQVRALVAGI